MSVCLSIYRTEHLSVQEFNYAWILWTNLSLSIVLWWKKLVAEEKEEDYPASQPAVISDPFWINILFAIDVILTSMHRLIDL